MMGLIGIICVIVLSYVLWQRQELKKFQVTSYEMTTEKVNKDLTIAVISDLHSFSYGKDNGQLLDAVRAQAPDLILVPGDLIVTAVTEKYDTALSLMKQLTALGVPVFFTNGNHESRAQQPEWEYAQCVEYRQYQDKDKKQLLESAKRRSDIYRQYWKSRKDHTRFWKSESRQSAVYRQYREHLKEYGVVILNNDSCEVIVNGVPMRISGLELPLYSYKKGKKPYLEEGYIQKQLGEASREHMQILLAHHPAFARQYAAWGADLTVCGHNHGGLVCIPGIGSIIAPQFFLFPEFDAGEFTIDGRKLYISRGLGTHTFHVRVFNRAELVVVRVKAERNEMSA